MSLQHIHTRNTHTQCICICTLLFTVNRVRGAHVTTIITFLCRRIFFLLLVLLLFVLSLLSLLYSYHFVDPSYHLILMMKIIVIILCLICKNIKSRPALLGVGWIGWWDPRGMEGSSCPDKIVNENIIMIIYNDKSSASFVDRARKTNI